MAKISPKSGSLSAIIRSYKSVCTREFNKLDNAGWFAWQPKFYDHIVRNQYELEQKRQYIRNNPANWKIDENNPNKINIRKTNYAYQ